MRIFKKIKKWLLSGIQDELNEITAWAEYWEKQAKYLEKEVERWEEKFEEADKTIIQLQSKITKQDEFLQSQKQQISELEDEIDIQKSKAAKYLSYYLTEMEKHAPND